MNVRLPGMSSSAAASLCAGTVLLTCLLLEAAAAPTGVGYRETVIAPVPTGETSNLVDRLFISEGTYNKTEAGTLALAASNLVQQGEGRLVVREGVLRIQGDTRTPAAPAPCPHEILANAAFWVDATTNLVTVSSNDNTYVDAWLDVREPDTEAPFPVSARRRQLDIHQHLPPMYFECRHRRHHALRLVRPLRLVAHDDVDHAGRHGR